MLHQTRRPLSFLSLLPLPGTGASGTRKCVISLRQRRAPRSLGADARVHRGERRPQRNGGRRPRRATMQVSSLNEVKIYSLSCGKSLPEVSHPAVLAGQPPLSSALSLACFSWDRICPRLGEVRVLVSSGAGRCR